MEEFEKRFILTENNIEELKESICNCMVDNICEIIDDMVDFRFSYLLFHDNLNNR